LQVCFLFLFLIRIRRLNSSFRFISSHHSKLNIVQLESLWFSNRSFQPVFFYTPCLQLACFIEWNLLKMFFCQKLSNSNLLTLCQDRVRTSMRSVLMRQARLPNLWFFNQLVRCWHYVLVPLGLKNISLDKDVLSFIYFRKKDKTNLSHDGLNPAHVRFWMMNNHTFSVFCGRTLSRADIEGSKCNVALGAWLQQASYPCGNFSVTSRKSKFRIF